jgi:hypothetical protein
MASFTASKLREREDLEDIAVVLHIVGTRLDRDLRKARSSLFAALSTTM